MIDEKLTWTAHIFQEAFDKETCQRQLVVIGKPGWKYNKLQRTGKCVIS